MARNPEPCWYANVGAQDAELTCVWGLHCAAESCRTNLLINVIAPGDQCSCIFFALTLSSKVILNSSE